MYAKSSPPTAPLVVGVYCSQWGKKARGCFILFKRKKKILKGLRVRSKNTGKNGALVKQERERESEEGGGATLSGFPFEELQGLLTWPRKQMAYFLSFFLCRRLVIRKCKKKGGRRIENATCNAHHYVPPPSEGPHNEPVACPNPF